MSTSFEPIKVTFTPVALSPDSRPSLPRSGACAAALPDWHPEEAIMLGGYTEDRSGGAAAGTGGAGAGVAHGSAAAPPLRGPTIEAWTFSSEGGGRWRRIEYAEGSPMPQPRLTCQAAVVGDELWLVGGWDPSVPAPPPGQPPAAGAPEPFLNDVWALDLRSYRWRRVEVAGEEMPRISRFAMAALPGGRLLLHAHRCDEYVLLLQAGQGAGQGAGGQEAAGQATLSRVAVRGVFPGDQSPPSRGLHSLTAAAAPPAQPPLEAAAAAGSVGPEVPGTALYVYGGAPQSGPMYGDLWALDPATMAWQQLEPSGPTPQARCSHVAGACGPGGRFLLVVGGSFYEQPGKLQPLDDVVLYDTQTNRWLEPEVSGPRPHARNAAIMVPLRPSGGGGGGAEGGGQRFLYHGGWRPFVQTYDDSYVVTVTTAA